MHSTTRTSDVTFTKLRYVGGWNEPVTRPFNFRYTLWKPSHFVTGLEIHTLDTTWRTFRESDTIFGVRLRNADPNRVRLDVWSQGDGNSALLDRLLLRIRRCYGFDDDPRPFTHLLRKNGHARQFKPLLNSRISCPESIFEIAVLSVLLQNTTIARTTQMLRNLLITAGTIVDFDGVQLWACFTPAELAAVGDTTLRGFCRVGYRAPTLQAIGDYFVHAGNESELSSSAALIDHLLEVRGIGPYSAAVIAHAALRDLRAAGLDVWNTRLAANLFGLKEDATRDEVLTQLSKHYPGFEGIALLYITEAAFVSAPLDPLTASVAEARRRSREQVRRL